MTTPRESAGAMGYATVEEFTAATGVTVDQRVIVEELEHLRDEGWLSAGETRREPLSETDVEFLDAHGGVRDDREALVAARVGSRLRHEHAAKDTWSVEQVADLLGVSTSRVRHRVSDGTLYSYPTGGRGVARRLPAWQFDEGESIPHLAAVLRALPEDFTPVEVHAFVLNARVDHPIRDATVPLVSWLRDGGDPAPALELAAAQAHVP